MTINGSFRLIIKVYRYAIALFTFLSFFTFPSKGEEQRKAMLLDQVMAAGYSDGQLRSTAGELFVENLYAGGLDSFKKNAFVEKFDLNQVRGQLRELWDKSYSEAELEYFLKLLKSGPVERFSQHKQKIDEQVSAIVFQQMKDRFKKASGFDPKERPGLLTSILWRIFPDTKVECEN